MVGVESRTSWSYSRIYNYRADARAPVCTENLNPDVVVMKPAEDRV